ncbi:unnamed protein product [Darwinula stevensoni]|uniref:Uncharacterized protein n=1 Tax=Darwinula stevensoni TaxID=69355 RepID=A0A7R9A3V7_9CRUS|nr:unnamed protein product [Darwinula stevensoni]CAG0891350.1 unnamed protein product [Darwinula stevensoni]
MCSTEAGIEAGQMASRFQVKPRECFLIVCLVGLFTQTLSCFITNCPPGKRSGAKSEVFFDRQCAACGPGGAGRCFGPKICCGPSIGCLMSHPTIKNCEMEAKYPVLCDNKSKPCGEGNQGRCAANGVCCQPFGCNMDSRCTEERTLEELEDEYEYEENGAPQYADKSWKRW